MADFGLVPWTAGETEAERYRTRRRRCVKDCDAVLILGDLTSPGSRGLIRDCRALGKRWIHVEPGLTTPRHVVQFLRDARVSRLMTAGNRECRDPGIAARVERFLLVVFRSLATTGRPTT